MFILISWPAAFCPGLGPFRHAVDDPLDQQKSAVYSIYGEYVVRGTKVHLASLRHMFKTGIRELTGLNDERQAWRQFIRDDDKVALVFTEFGGKELATNKAVAQALLSSLYEMGFRPDQFMVIGLHELPAEAEGTIAYEYGWQKQPVDFGITQDNLAAWLDEVTAIINIPSIMDDNVTGLRGALYNLSLPLVQRPARLYANHADPFIPIVYDTPEIRSKVRLHIGNCLRVLYYGGPIVNQSYVYEHCNLLFSTDPVAMDTIALNILRHARRHRPLPAGVNPGLDANYLETAHQMGLGHNRLNYINYVQMKHNKW